MVNTLAGRKPELVIGRYQSVVWTAADGSAVIARMLGDKGESFTVKGPGDAGPALQSGLSYRFYGRWAEHERYGRQFTFDAYTPCLPADRRGVIAYLTSVAEGVGEKRAAKLWELYGEFAVETLRTNPEAVAEAGVMPLSEAQDASSSLRDEVGNEAIKIELLGLFAGRGFQGGRLIKACIDRWGVRAPELVRKNPYRMLLAKLPSVGWARADKLYRDLRLPLAAMKRQALAAVYHLRQDGQGHTWHRAETVGTAVRQLIGEGADPLRSLRLAERGRMLRILRLPAGERWLAEAGKAANEARVAERVRELMTWQSSPNPNWRGCGQPSLRRRLTERLTGIANGH